MQCCWDMSWLLVLFPELAGLGGSCPAASACPHRLQLLPADQQGGGRMQKSQLTDYAHSDWQLHKQISNHALVTNPRPLVLGWAGPAANQMHCLAQPKSSCLFSRAGALDCGPSHPNQRETGQRSLLDFCPHCQKLLVSFAHAALIHWWNILQGGSTAEEPIQRTGKRGRDFRDLK